MDSHAIQVLYARPDFVWMVCVVTLLALDSVKPATYQTLGEFAALLLDNL